ncbi:hypothetical protein DdX_15730 [Ditylenchus destructor]|uniref:Uncharacterized protein n=1 Tax=Ditylenchus destructor TaxID=166010 RepID=A0AAD4MS89_9BILA|nr:hypothetical protein DdX_15730 [Ditylenchus destructor]
MRLIPQKHFVNLLAGAFNQDHGRLRCEKLKFKLEGNVQKFINWTKNQVRCDEIVIEDDLTSNHDQELLDLLVTGAQCTSKVSMAYSMVNGTQIVVDVVQKFLDLKSSDECQVIESIHGNTANREVVKVMRRDYDDFIPEEERDYGTEHAFDFGNSDVGKKLQLSIEIFEFSRGKEKMRKSVRPTEKQAMPANKAQREPRAKKKRSDGRTTITVTLDDDTMVEVFKHMYYGQLAKNSLVSNRFRDLIQSHRHKLALLYVDNLVMDYSDSNRSLIRILDQYLSPEAYNEWVDRNGYSKQIPVEGQVVEECHLKLWASAAYKNRNCCQPPTCTKTVIFAQIKFNHNHWPLFQHFVRLLTDPFIFIHNMRLIPHDDVLNFLLGAFNQDSNRLQCKTLKLNLNGNVQKFIGWARNHIFCDEIVIDRYDNVWRYYEALFDLFVSGAHCTAAIRMYYCIASKVVVDVVQKFLDLKYGDECGVVPFIKGNVSDSIAESLKSKYSAYIKDDSDSDSEVFGTVMFEFVNSDVRKKLQLTATAEVVTFGAKMRRADRLSEKQTKPSDGREPSAKKKRWDGSITTTAIFDNETMVETFKFLTYMQLAKTSQVSARFSNLIRSHRHKLALLYVDSVVLNHSGNSDFRTRPILVEIFDQKLSPEAYKEWVSLNGYSKEIPTEDQVVGEQSAQYGHRVYELWADAGYKGSTNVFYAQAKLSHENWPVFQHFVRLITDPFVYIQQIDLIPQNDVLHLLIGAFTQDSNRLQWKKLRLNLEGNVQKFIGWIKGHVLCDTITIGKRSCFTNTIITDNCRRSNYDEGLLDLMMTGAHCTSKIDILTYDSSKVIVDFVQKFMDLKTSDECQVVESIQGPIEAREVIEVLKREYAGSAVKEERDEEDDITEQKFMGLKSSDECQLVGSIRCNILRISSQMLKPLWLKHMVKEERQEDDGSIERIFEFVNNIERKLTLSVKIYDNGELKSLVNAHL